MFLRRWEDLPTEMQNDKVRPYYDILQKKKSELFLKFIFDRVVSLIMLIILIPVFVVLAVLIKLDSPGEVFFRQERITQYGKSFSIYKFRTMVKDAEKIGTQVTTNSDSRITSIGNELRRCRLDELPQLINILKGEMSFVGTRPEVVKYVEHYTPEMLATLLLPAGVTSEASIEYKDEEKLLINAGNADYYYVNVVLKQKMKCNLKNVKEFGFFRELKTMVKTLGAVI